MPDHVDEPENENVPAQIVKQANGTRGVGTNVFCVRKQVAFLEAFAANGAVGEAAKLVGVSAATVRKYRREQPDTFGVAYQAAYDEYLGKLEAEVHRRAVEGWDEPVFHEGRVVGHKRRFSDRMLELLAKRHIPEYRDKVEHTGGTTSKVLVVAAQAPDAKAWADQVGASKASEEEASEGLSQEGLAGVRRVKRS